MAPRVNIHAILTNPAQRLKLLKRTIQATINIGRDNTRPAPTSISCDAVYCPIDALEDGPCYVCGKDSPGGEKEPH